MKTRIVRIGNSRGVRIPKPLLERSGLGEVVEMQAEEGQITLRPATHPRADWDEAFRAMAENGDERLLDGDVLPPTRFDEEEWEW
jgi:antitoxin MazE